MVYTRPILTISSPRLTTLYQILHDAIHAKSGQEASLKLQYIRTESESVMGWVRSVDFISLACHSQGALLDNAAV